MSFQPKPMVLLVLDGWGYSESEAHNAIMAANTPNWDKIWSSYPKTLISGSGLDVGLPHGQMGNSEVGHLNLGAGRVVYQDYTRITKSIEDGDFFDNETILGAVDKAVGSDKAVHIMGLLSPGGVHSHEEHILSMMELAAKRGTKKVYVHAFLDGRDMPPRSAKASLIRFQDKAEELGVPGIISMVGRYYAMDRDQRWERVQAAYDMLTLRKAEYQYDDTLTALEAAYQRDENDEFVKTTIIGEHPAIESGDAVIFMNYRADRARQLSRSFVESDFSGFAREATPELSGFVMLTQYAADIPAPAAFPPLKHKNVLGEYLQSLGKKQLRIAETEKYAHVTFFFNGGVEQPFVGEERELIPSPQVATYDLQPEMNAPLMAEKLVEAIKAQSFDVIIGNFANPDMVGHTGNFDATVKAIEAIDQCLGQIVSALQEAGGEALITADHGNAEKMADPSTGQAHTAHSSNPVPFVFVGRDAEVLVDDGVLADVAPTLLSLMGLEIPAEMTGRPIMSVQ
ncbi:2,3-bisphosphoglycerate-independent phosphoglycerate mutase [Pleionea sp. CnH1-48]|uniref:2,3-bisphosphoglycerate-independent phosphoglycerate mutase n=1 Tax=Pleionea sp. CnH1-48 TaxID=2954494 RepID=UPI002097CEB0|nr:2,3-bisphosphoglycerate-independent phosphoglycerate mutase [Pleionea sp. CnH1-48]MCO7225179.1 2,3-bisphosphoglycerate-independent phosphoglycerate mutase [Pleionea sp. CnH1-48]